MRRNSDITKRFPNLYRHDLLDWALYEQRLTRADVARLAKIHYRTTGKVFEGTANNRKVWPIAKVLGIDWAMLHNFDLKEVDFHLAVRNGKGG
jgi:hypothetical protein